MWGQEERSDVGGKKKRRDMGGKKEVSQVRERIDLFFILSVGVARLIPIPKPTQ